MATLGNAIRPRGRNGGMVCGAVRTTTERGAQPTRTFHCVETGPGAPVPAAVYFDAWKRRYGAGMNGSWSQTFVSGLGDYAWLNTYNKRNFTVLRPSFKEAKWTVERVDVPNAQWALESAFTIDRLGAEPRLVDLYEEKLALEDAYFRDPTQKELDAGARQPGDRVQWATKDDMHPAIAERVREMNRARRYYLLAAYALLSRAPQFTHRGISVNNLVGSVLVADDGRLLAWGVNTGSYRHAEVNTLLNYFRRTQTTVLPEKSVLFSTLKPCVMCSTFIKSSWSPKDPTRVWYGQFDPGPAGSDPLLGAMSKSFRDPEAENKAVRARRPGSQQKEAVSDSLETEFSKIRGASAATWTKTSTAACDLFMGTEAALVHKMAKDRDDGPKRRVLEHLGPWVRAGFS